MGKIYFLHKKKIRWIWHYVFYVCRFLRRTRSKLLKISPIMPKKLLNYDIGNKKNQARFTMASNKYIFRTRIIMQSLCENYFHWLKLTIKSTIGILRVSSQVHLRPSNRQLTAANFYLQNYYSLNYIYVQWRIQKFS